MADHSTQRANVVDRAGKADAANAATAPPTLAIVVPVLNESAALAVHLVALQDLRARGVQIVVADGGSRDDSVLIAEAHADQVLSAPAGRASQMNAGAAACHSDLLLFLHADTRLPERADDLVRQALAGRHVWGRFDVRFNADRALLRTVAGAMNRRSRLTGICTGDQALFMRRAAFEAVGGFPPLALMEDIELSRRLKRLSRPACVRAQVVTSARRWQQHGAWRTIALMWWLRAAYFFGVDPERLQRWYRAPKRGGQP